MASRVHLMLSCQPLLQLCVSNQSNPEVHMALEGDMSGCIDSCTAGSSTPPGQLQHGLSLPIHILWCNPQALQQLQLQGLGDSPCTGHLQLDQS